MIVIACSNKVYHNSIKEFTKGYDNVKLITCKNDLSQLSGDIDYIFFPHWSYLIPKKIHKKYKCIAFHMTDLPFGKGGSPLQNLIMRKIYKTKITAFKVTEGIDSGPIYLKKDFDITLGSAKQIYEKASHIILGMIEEILKMKIEPQHPTVTPYTCQAMFERRTSDQSNMKGLPFKKVFDFIRMLDCEGYPRAFIETENLKIEFGDAIDTGNAVWGTVCIREKEY